MTAVARTEDIVSEIACRFLGNFKRPATLLVAISGGSDSTGLLVALADQCASGRYPGIRLAACTIDHALRPGSAGEADWVAALCARYGVSHISRRWEGRKPASGLQAAARTKRYELLLDAARGIGADAILAAHTCDDQRETVAMRAARSGEGIGLSGMADAVLLKGDIWLLRPFLTVERATIRGFLTSREETWIDDPSNQNPGFERVRVRGQAGVETVDPVPTDRLASSHGAADFLAGNVRADHCCFVLPPPAVMLALADADAWRGLGVLVAAIGGRVHALEARAAARLRVFLASGTLSRLTAGRVVFDRRRDGLYLYRECRGIEPMQVRAGASATWDSRYRISNRTDRTLVVSAAGEQAGEGHDADLHGPLRRAARAAPCLKFEDGRPAEVGAVDVAPLLSPYADFLPRFDLPIAQVLVGLFGCRPYVSPPNE